MKQALKNWICLSVLSSALSLHCTVQSFPVILYCPVLCPVSLLFGIVLSCCILSRSLSCVVLSCCILSPFSILCCPVLLYPAPFSILCYPVLLYPVPFSIMCCLSSCSFTVWYYPVLSCSVLSCSLPRPVLYIHLVPFYPVLLFMYCPDHALTDTIKHCEQTLSLSLY